MHNVGIHSTIIIDTYKALFLSYLSYCVIVYGTSHAYLLDKLQVLQNNAIRAMFGYKRDTNVKETMLKHKLLSVRYIYKFELGIFAYKNFNNQFVKDMSYYFDPNKNQNRHSKPLKLPVTRCNYRLNSADVAMARLWNNMSDELRGCETTRVFKRKWFNQVILDQSVEQ